MDREQIPERGAKYLLLAEWPAKLCILLPVILAGLSLGDMVRSIALGVLLWCFAIGIVLRWVRPGQDLFSAIEMRAGKTTAAIFCTVSLWYFLAHTAVFARLWAELFRTYFMPFVPAAVLCVLPLAAGHVYLEKGLSFRVGVSRHAGIALLVLAAGLACLAGNEVPVGAYRSVVPRILPENAQAVHGVAGGACEVFLCLGGVFLPFLSGHLIAGQAADTGRAPERNEDIAGARNMAVRRTGCICAAAAGAFCAASGFLLTARERWASDFPAIAAMRVLRPFGYNAGRLETVLALLLLAGLFMTAVGGLWYTQKCVGYLYTAGKTWYCGERVPDGRTVARIRRWLVLLAVYLLTAGFADAFSAITFYRAYNVQILVPVMLVFYAALSAKNSCNAGNECAILTEQRENAGFRTLMRYRKGGDNI